MVLISAIMILLLSLAGGCRLRVRYQSKLIVLSMEPMLLIGSFAAIIVVDFFKGMILA